MGAAHDPLRSRYSHHPRKPLDPSRHSRTLSIEILLHFFPVSLLSDPISSAVLVSGCPYQTYHYHLDTGIAHDPLRSRYSHHPRKPLDLAAMRAGAALLVGRHDFTQFSNNSPERLWRNPVKTLERLDIIEEGPAAVRLEVRPCCFC
jgi:hypothetical protein